MSDLLEPGPRGRQLHSLTTRGGANIMNTIISRAKKRTWPTGVLSWSGMVPRGKSWIRSKPPEIKSQGNKMARLNLRLAVTTDTLEHVPGEKRQ